MKYDPGAQGRCENATAKNFPNGTTLINIVASWHGCGGNDIVDTN
jgi:hypothetical protein